MTSRTLPTCTVADIVRLQPCCGSDRVKSIAAEYRLRETDALRLLSLGRVCPNDRLWLVFHATLLPHAVEYRFACEVARKALLAGGWQDKRLHSAIDTRIKYERGEASAGELSAAIANAHNAAHAEIGALSRTTLAAVAHANVAARTGWAAVVTSYLVRGVPRAEAWEARARLLTSLCNRYLAGEDLLATWEPTT